MTALQVRLRHETATTTVVLDDTGVPWLTLSRDGAKSPLAGIVGRQATLQRGKPTAIGGRAPDSARRAHVRYRPETWLPGAVDNGYWVALLPDHHDQGLPPIRFHDADGAIVTRLTPADQPTSLTNAELSRYKLPQHCPCCDNTNWAWLPADAALGNYIACATCGHTDGAIVGSFRI